MQARFERLVARVDELEKENASLRFQVKSNKESFDWARCQAHLTRLVDANKDLKADLERSNAMHELREKSFS
jgi:septal ring factor EnvC (AmiA/AmiB activator)